MKQKFDKVPLSIPLLPAHLANLGFKPHMVGKWHLGHYKDEFTPTRQVAVMSLIFVVESMLQANPIFPRRGFSSHFGYWAGKEDYYDHSNKNSVISTSSLLNSSDRTTQHQHNQLNSLNLILENWGQLWMFLTLTWDCPMSSYHMGCITTKHRFLI